VIKMEPFREAITISSICNTVFRTIFLKPDTLGIIPRAGYRIGDRQSVEALNGWRILARQGTILLKPVMEGGFICLGYQI